MYDPVLDLIEQEILFEMAASGVSINEAEWPTAVERHIPIAEVGNHDYFDEIMGLAGDDIMGSGPAATFIDFMDGTLPPHEAYVVGVRFALVQYLLGRFQDAVVDFFGVAWPGGGTRDIHLSIRPRSLFVQANLMHDPPATLHPTYDP